MNVYDMMRGPEFWNYYRKQTSRDGSSLSDSEMERQDHQHQMFVDRMVAAINKSDARSESTKRQEESKLGDAFEGGFAVVDKEATISVERRMVHEKVWLPVRTEITGRHDRSDGRTLRPSEHVISEFSNFKKFTVDTIIRPAVMVQ